MSFKAASKSPVCSNIRALRSTALIYFGFNSNAFVQSAFTELYFSCKLQLLYTHITNNFDNQLKSNFHVKLIITLQTSYYQLLIRSRSILIKSRQFIFILHGTNVDCFSIFSNGFIIFFRFEIYISFFFTL